eukprot:2478704-Pleurochrysis_carterae.AAC.4
MTASMKRRQGGSCRKICSLLGGIVAIALVGVELENVALVLAWHVIVAADVVCEPQALECGTSFSRVSAELEEVLELRQLREKVVPATAESGRGTTAWTTAGGSRAASRKIARDSHTCST